MRQKVRSLFCSKFLDTYICCYHLYLHHPPLTVCPISILSVLLVVLGPTDGQDGQTMSPYCITRLRLPLLPVGGQSGEWRVRGGSRAVAAAGLRSEESEGTIGASRADTPAPRGPEPATTNISSLADGLEVGLRPDTCRENFTPRQSSQAPSVIMMTPINQLSIELYAKIH